MKYPFMVKYNDVIYQAGMEVPDEADVAGVETVAKKAEEPKAEEPKAEATPKKRGRPKTDKR